LVLRALALSGDSLIPHLEGVFVVQNTVVPVAQKVPDGWTLEKNGTTGMNAMQLAVISSTHTLILDKVKHNPLMLDNQHSASNALPALAQLWHE